MTPYLNTWTLKAPMPTARAYAAITVYQNKIYVIGGTTGAGAKVRYEVGNRASISFTGVTEVYDPETDKWRTGAPMPTPMSEVTASTVNGKIYVIGGNFNQVYNILTNSWTTKASPPVFVNRCTSAVVNSIIYVFGYTTSDSSMRTTYTTFTLVYDTQNDSWSYATPSPILPVIPVAVQTTGVFAPELIYLISCPNVTQIYNPAKDSWSTGTQMNPNRGTFGAAGVNDRLYVIGGGSLTFPTLYTAFGYNEQYTPNDYDKIRVTPTSLNSTQSPTPTVSSGPSETPKTIETPKAAPLVTNTKLTTQTSEAEQNSLLSIEVTAGAAVATLVLLITTLLLLVRKHSINKN